MHRPKATSAENGRHSQGPKTKEGKERSRLNALVHGICAKEIFLLPTESPEAFAEDFQAFIATYQPADRVQFNLVSKMAGLSWLLDRARGMEKAMFLEAHENSNSNDLVKNILSVLDTPRFNTLQLYQSRLDRGFDRTLNRLIKTREKFGPADDDPEPESIPVPAVDDPIAAEPPAEPPPAEYEPGPVPEPKSETVVTPAPQPLAPYQRPGEFVLPPWRDSEDVILTPPPPIARQKTPMTLDDLPPGSYVVAYLDKQT